MNYRLIKSTLALITIALFISSTPATAQSPTYTWLNHHDSTQSIANRIPPPDDHKCVPVIPGSFGHWLRHLPLKEGNPPIYYHDGGKKFNQMANYAVIDIDVGERNLQQCADAVIRLRAEYLYSKAMYDSIAFNFTSGDRFKYRAWLDGKTPIIEGNNVSWDQQAARANDRANFREYLDIIFMYAGSYSLSKELAKVSDIADIQIGDVFIEGGFPGHAIIVVDLVEHIETGEKRYLLAQSYMPAQSIHIIKMPLSNPWFDLGIGDKLWTLEWVFEKDELMRFR
ncbi:MAG: DUF4846 domain-containing protein [candidate division Zixibacteria bacterium]|nr:DUF4846 domain-containing protein [candidate division Zixibacteria bacterium]